MYYFDQAATSMRKPPAVADAVYHALASETLGNPSRSGHEASVQSSRIIYETREVIRKLFRAQDHHVVLTKNATEAINIALKGLFQEGDHLITTVMEHNAVLRPLYELQEQGVSLDFVSCDVNTGQLLYHQFAELLTEKTKAIIVTQASNVTGNATNLEWISDFCKRHKLKLIVDGASAAGIIDISLDDLTIDIFCFTGHKSLYGPQGTGGMCIKKGIQIKPIITGGSGFATFSKTQPTSLPESLEAGTMNVHGFAGLEAGVKYILAQSVPSLHNKIMNLATHFFDHVHKLNGIRVYGNPTALNIGIVALNIGDYDSTEISSLLADHYEIFTRPGSHCAPLVHRQLGTVDQGIVRFSFSAFHILDDVEYAIKSLEQLVKELM